MKRILLIATGGTIASKKTELGLSPEISGEELFAGAPEILELCQVESLQLLNIDSTNIQPEHWLLMVKAIEERFDRFDGFVISHGTDTMAYTAAALSYLIQNPGKPIVLTGAQRPLLSPISDARKNLVDSFRLACHADACGVHIVFSGQVILGTRAKKLKTKSYSAFSSINYPEVATIEGSHILQFTPPLPQDGPPCFYHALTPKVFLAKLIPGMNPDILNYAVSHYDAVVLESYGSGGLPFADQRNFLEKLDVLTKAGKIVVIATQALFEGSDLEVYEVGNRALRQYNVLQSYDMTIEAIVTKLMWLLPQGLDFPAFRDAFYTPIARDILFRPDTEKGT